MLKFNQLVVIGWAGSVISKAVYAFIGFKALRELERGEVSTVALIILFALGLLSALGGILLIRRLHEKGISIPSLMALLSVNRSSGFTPSESSYFGLYFIGLGMTETTALFGLAGFILSGNTPFFLGMLAIAISAWAFCYPRGPMQNAQRHPCPSRATS